MTKEQMIDNVMDNFDFNRVHKVMVFLDWKWAMYGRTMFEVPTESYIRKTVRLLLNEAYDRETTIATGGFKVVYDEYATEGKSLTLEFILNSWEVCEEDEFEI